MNMKIPFAAALLAMAACSSGKGADNSVCGKAAGPLAGIVMLETDAKESPDDLDKLEAEVAAVCKETKAEETAKAALECYVENKGTPGYHLFKKCPEQPGKALIEAVVAKH